MWIVMTARQKMPASVRAPYVKIALVKLTQEYTARDMRPKMMSENARGVLQLHRLGYYHAGATMRSRYQQVLAEAYRRAYVLNNTAPAAEGELLMSWGGSA